MTRTLYLLRHAKSSWDDAGLADHDRPLKPRGKRACKAIAEHMRKERIVPDLVLSSSARRAAATLERVRAGFGDAQVAIEIEAGLYHASLDELLARVRRLPAEARSAMLVGHNPGLHELASSLAGDGADLARMRTKFPTAALATLAFKGDWADVAPGVAELIAFVTPRELA